MALRHLQRYGAVIPQKTVGRMFWSPVMSHDTSPDIAAFVAELGRQGMAAKTITTYTSDLVSFARWFATLGEAIDQ